MADEYKSVLTGGLSLKGGLLKGNKKVKKKRRREEMKASAVHTSSKADHSESTLGSEDYGSTVLSKDADGAGEDLTVEGSSGDNDDAVADELDSMLTPAQRRFRKKQLQREGKKIRTMVSKTHRERVEEFNALLASMTEHNDIPRCSAAGNG